MTQDAREAAPKAAPREPQKSLTEGVLEICDNPELFEQMAQEFLKDRGGRLGIEAARQDLQIVCAEMRPAGLPPKGHGRHQGM